MTTFLTALWWSGIVVIYAATLALVYRTGRTDGRRQGEQRLAVAALVSHLCAKLSCDGSELAALIKSARETAGQSVGHTESELEWAYLHIGLLQAEKERMK